MANSLLTPDVVTKDALTILHNNIVFCRNVNRQYDDSNVTAGQKNGGSIRIRLPNKYTTSTGAALSAQDTIENYVTISTTTQRHVDTNFTTVELTEEIDTFAERILEPGMSVLGSMMDYDVMARALDVANSVGTPGTTPDEAADLLSAQKYLNYFATPGSQRYGVVNPDANAALVGGATNIYNTAGKGDQMYRSGLIASGMLGYDELSMSQNVRTHTNGAFAGTVLVDDASIATGDSTIGMDAFTDAAPTVKAGDVFTIAGVYSVNPETKQSTGQLQQFTVTADATGSTNAIGTVSFSPTIYSSASGALQNVDALPVDDAAVTFLGTASTAYPQNIVFHKDTFVVATTDLEMPEGVHFAARQVMDGISMRVVRQYRIGTDDIPCRIDILYGSVTTRPETGCRLWG